MKHAWNNMQWDEGNGYPARCYRNDGGVVDFSQLEANNLRSTREVAATLKVLAIRSLTFALMRMEQDYSEGVASSASERDQVRTWLETAERVNTPEEVIELYRSSYCDRVDLEMFYYGGQDGNVIALILEQMWRVGTIMGGDLNMAFSEMPF